MGPGGVPEMQKPSLPSNTFDAIPLLNDTCRNLYFAVVKNVSKSQLTSNLGAYLFRRVFLHQQIMPPPWNQFWPLVGVAQSVLTKSQVKMVRT